VTEESHTREVLTEACKARGKAAEIAAAFEVSPSTVKRWLDGGDIPPPMAKLLRLYLLGEIPFEMVHPKQDLTSVLKFTPGEWRIIETLALRGGVTAGEWIAGHVRNYLTFLDNTGGVNFPTGKTKLRVAEEPAEAKKKPSA
jgi:hypothetical protein